MSVVDAFQVIGALANVVMAGAAVWALNQWRKQIAGESNHELAKKVSATLRQVAIMCDITLKNIEWLHELEMNSEASDTLMAIALQETERGAEGLTAAVVELGALEGQIAVQWGEVVYGLIDIIRQESAMLSTHAHIEVRPELRDTDAAKTVFTASQLAPTFTRRAWKKSLDLYTQLAQDWLGFYVGRDAAKEMSAADLVAKRRNVDYEARQLAEPERLALKAASQRILAKRSAASEPKKPE